jgi:molecular chaperone GrpE
MNLIDQPFDPALADAVVHEPVHEEGEGEPVVTEVMRSGYTWNGRVLRAAMVKVKG